MNAAAPPSRETPIPPPTSSANTILPAGSARWRIHRAVATALQLAAAIAAATGAPANAPTSPRFELQLDAGTVTSLQAAGNPHQTEFLAEGARLGNPSVQFREAGGDWQSLDTTQAANPPSVEASQDPPRSTATTTVHNGKETTLVVESGFTLRAGVLEWTIQLANHGSVPLEIADLALPLPMNTSSHQRVPAVLKHSFISGNGSFVYWQRPDGNGPCLTLTPAGDTHFEYWEAQQGYRVFIHSQAAGAAAAARGTRWRQNHTQLTLAPAGQPGSLHSYGCRFRWAADPDEVRRILVEENGINVHVVPGMTVPTNLSAKISLQSKLPIESIKAEFPDQTTITPCKSRGACEIYQVTFAKTGEHRLTIHYGGGRRTHLEFFATEPLETLIRKRAAFITRCQHRDPAKWYHGLFSDWNMETQVLLGPDNPDRIKGWRIYAVSCDDPGLAKPAFLAAKNARLPVAAEVAAMDQYLEHFVWGGLQQTTREAHPYAIYGIPEWKTNRESTDPGPKGRQHIWRPYDYPHVVLMYLSMYETARDHPQIPTALPALEYLRRAAGTANAMFTIPLAIANWSAYGTGFYNELVIVDLIRELEANGLTEEAAQLRNHWEKKAAHFINHKPDLFQSEYAFDSTGFESTHALARYAVERTRTPAGVQSLGVSSRDAEHFMNAQMAANLACRGTIEPAYYYLGSDYRGRAGDAYTLTYMSQMGGWAVLDHALHSPSTPPSLLRTGYASYLSAWALMNTGPATANHGYWYPGPANDGAAGGGFEPAPFGTTWLDQPHHRGAWYYACETDLGYCAALRTAATVLADDPVFGRFCFGGDHRETATSHELFPKDGLRQRVHVRLSDLNASLALSPARIAASSPLVVAKDGSSIHFTLESDNPAPHPLRLELAGLPAGTYQAANGGPSPVTFTTSAAAPSHIEIPMTTSGQSLTIQRIHN